MSFLQANQYDFEDDEHIFHQKNLEIKQTDFGPWVQLSCRSEEKDIKNNKLKSIRDVNTADFLSTAFTQEYKGSRFKPKITKQKSQDIKEMNNDSNRIDPLPLRRASFISYPLPEGNSNIKQKKNCFESKKKVALNTTMYVYTNNKEYTCRKSSTHTSRSETITHQNPFREEISTPHTPFCQGNRNLQRILKVKQKIRIKKSVLVQKLKEKLVHVETELSPTKIKEQIENLHQRAWVSTTLRRQNQQDCEKKTFTKKEFDSIHTVRDRKNWTKYSKLRQCSLQCKLES